MTFVPYCWHLSMWNCSSNKQNYMDVILSIESVLEQRNCRLNGSWSECDVKQRWTISLPNPRTTLHITFLSSAVTFNMSPHTFSKHLSHNLTSTHTHHQHISPHRHLPHCIQAGSGNPTAQKPTLNTSLLENYRPVSLLPFIEKTLERVVFNQVSLFLSQNNKLDAKQSGFRSGYSTETALLSVTEALRIAKAESSVLILLDLSAAFDTVNHQILLSTLSSLDITGIPLRWFESYLTGRSFRVAWGGRYPKHINWSLGFPRDRFLDPSSSPHTLHHWLPSYRHMASPTISMLMTHSSISHFDQMIQR